MLNSLHVKNLALIEETEVYFENGLNILTGETGAGKSLLIGSINLALGAKFSKEMVRENAEYALAELVFTVSQKQQADYLNSLDIVLEDQQLILTRKWMNGRNICKINGENVNITLLQKVAEALIDIHGQHEHQSLFDKEKHLEILDEFSKKELAALKTELEKEYRVFLELKNKRNSSMLEEGQRLRESSLIAFEVNEIEEAKLIKGEDVLLESSYQKMLHGKKILEAVKDIYQKTGYEGPNAAGELIGHALRTIYPVMDLDADLTGLKAQLEDIDTLLNDFNRELSDYVSGLEYSEEDFQSTETRLNTINHLKAKYGNSIEEILKYQEEKKERLSELSDYDHYMEELKERLDAQREKVGLLSEQLSEIRQRYAKELADKIKTTLEDLNFLNVEFEIHFQKLKEVTQKGIDDVEFLISTNPGEPVKPLGKVASGGELSRVMLAIKTVLADQDEIETLIFDEIDVGISGRTAQKVSEKLAVIGRNHQVLCITHLPQIAAMADFHYVIEKQVVNEETITNIKKLNEEESIKELARILGGAKLTDTVFKSAKEMKELANSTKLYQIEK